LHSFSSSTLSLSTLSLSSSFKYSNHTIGVGAGHFSLTAIVSNLYGGYIEPDVVRMVGTFQPLGHPTTASPLVLIADSIERPLQQLPPQLLLDTLSRNALRM
jgi:hypothetical protein